MKRKILVMLEITVVLCSVFFVILPAAAAAEQASEVTASKEDSCVFG